MDEINTNVTETTGTEPKADTKTAEEMYAELLARRDEAAMIAMSGNKEDIERLAKEQLSVGEKKREL